MEKVISKIITIIKKAELDIGLAIVGSVNREQEYDDLDILVITEDIVKTKESFKKIFLNYNLREIDDAIKLEDFFSKEVSFGIYQKSILDKVIFNFILGTEIQTVHKTWTIGYWCTEALIEDLRKMKILLDDKELFLEKMKSKVNKDLVYAKKRILEECLEEIEIKSKMLGKYEKSIEHSFLINDLILASVRAVFICEDKFIYGFSKLTKIIEKLSEPYKTLITSFLKQKDLDSLIKLKKIFKNKLNEYNTFYLGTWQFSGDFKKLTEKEIINLIRYSKKMGVNKFDTALVYGKGNVEKILGRNTEKDDIILTKIPAKIKPKLDEKRIENFYTQKHIKECVSKSLKNLNREYIDICLLHNWSTNWEKELKIIKYLEKLKKERVVKKIGISLPNNFNKRLSDTYLEKIDVIEAPFNSQNKWIEKDIIYYKSFGIEIILRSLFLQGEELSNSKNTVEDIILNAMKYNTSIVIGNSTKEQIKENINIIKNKSRK